MFPMNRTEEEAMLRARAAERLEAERAQRERELMDEERRKIADRQAAEQAAWTNGLNDAQQAAADILRGGTKAMQRRLAAARALVPLVQEFVNASQECQGLERQAAEVLARFHSRLSPQDAKRSSNYARSAAGWPGVGRVGLTVGHVSENIPAVVVYLLAHGDITPRGLDMGGGVNAMIDVTLGV